jgi:hypothetical protein
MSVDWMVILGMSMTPMAKICAHIRKLREIAKIKSPILSEDGSQLS